MDERMHAHGVSMNCTRAQTLRPAAPTIRIGGAPETRSSAGVVTPKPDPKQTGWRRRRVPETGSRVQNVLIQVALLDGDVFPDDEAVRYQFEELRKNRLTCSSKSTKMIMTGTLPPASTRPAV